MARVKRNRSEKEATSAQAALQQYRQEYEHLKEKLRHLGYICIGSIIQRWISCGNSACACAQDPKKRHGPYLQWTRKLAGRTQARMLSDSLVRLYREGIRNHRRLDSILQRMRKVSLQAFDAAKIHSKP